MAGEKNKAIRDVVTGFLDGLRVGGTGDWRQFCMKCLGVPPIPQFQAIRQGDKEAQAGFIVQRIPTVKSLPDARRPVDVKLLVCATSTRAFTWVEGSMVVREKEGEWLVEPGSWIPQPAQRRFP